MKLRNQSYRDALKHASFFPLPSFAFRYLKGIVLSCDSSSCVQFIYIRKHIQKIAKLFLSLLLVLSSDFKDGFSVVLWLIDELHSEVVIIIGALLVAGQNRCKFCVVLWTFGEWSEEIAFGRGYEIKVIIFSWLCIAGSGLFSLIDGRWLIVSRDILGLMISFFQSSIFLLQMRYLFLIFIDEFPHFSGHFIDELLDLSLELRNNLVGICVFRQIIDRGKDL